MPTNRTYSHAGSRPKGSVEKLSLCRQDYVRVIEGSWTPSQRELDTLHRLYINMLRVLDARIQLIVEYFLEVRGKENCLVMITADHGQALGEGGWLFHMASAEEAVLRIPLIVRFPHGQPSGVARGWASLVDVFPTILATAAVPPGRPSDGVLLPELIRADREGPVWSLGDGLPWRHLEGIVRSPATPPGRRPTNRTWITAYERLDKSVYDLRNGTFSSHRVELLPPEAGASQGTDPGPSPRVRTQVIALSKKLSDQAAASNESTTLKRLESWGYGV